MFKNNINEIKKTDNQEHKSYNIDYKETRKETRKETKKTQLAKALRSNLSRRKYQSNSK
jgi:hypothetical protein